MWEKETGNFMHFAILFPLDDLHILCTFMHVLKSALILGCIIPQQKLPPVGADMAGRTYHFRNHSAFHC